MIACSLGKLMPVRRMLNNNDDRHAVMKSAFSEVTLRPYGKSHVAFPV